MKEQVSHALTFIPQREEELTRKLNKIVSEKIGERAKDMIYVDLVFTAPESQGHGYASTLLKTLTALVCFMIVELRRVLTELRNVH